jgi:hypothetical protein
VVVFVLPAIFSVVRFCQNVIIMLVKLYIFW